MHTLLFAALATLGQVPEPWPQLKGAVIDLQDLRDSAERLRV